MDLFTVDKNIINFNSEIIKESLNKTFFFTIAISKKQNYFIISEDHKIIVRYNIAQKIISGKFLHLRMDFGVKPTMRLMGEISYKYSNTLKDEYIYNTYPKAPIIFENVYFRGCNKPEEVKGNKLSYRGLLYTPHHIPQRTYYCCICDYCNRSFFITATCTARNLDGNQRTIPIEPISENTKSLCCPHCSSIYIDYENHPNYHIEGSHNDYDLECHYHLFSE